MTIYKPDARGCGCKHEPVYLHYLPTPTSYPIFAYPPMQAPFPAAPQAPAHIQQRYASFYALSPTDNAVAITPGGAVAFPNSRVTGSDITTANGTVFNIPEAGVYYASFRVNTADAGQLQLLLNGVPVTSATYGSAAADGVIQGSAILNIPANSTLSVINPSTQTTDITVAQAAGGAAPTASDLTLIRLS